MDYIEFDAYRKPNPSVCVFFEGQDITDLTFYARVPALPNVEAPGRIGRYTQWPPEYNPETNDVVSLYQEGIVRWEFIEITTTWLATRLLRLDGLQQCDLAAEMARRDPKATDALCVTLGEAVAAVIDPQYNSG